MADLLASNVDLDSIGVVRIVGIPSKRRDTFVIDPLFSPTPAYLLDGLLVEGLAHYIDHVRTGNICRLCAHRSPPSSSLPTTAMFLVPHRPDNFSPLFAQET